MLPEFRMHESHIDSAYDCPECGNEVHQKHGNLPVAGISYGVDDHHYFCLHCEAEVITEIEGWYKKGLGCTLQAK